MSLLFLTLMWYNMYGDNMKNGLKNICFFSLIFIFVDQIIKIVLSNNLVVNQNVILIKDFFSITLVHNSGAAFSILSGSRYLLIFIAIMAIIGLFFYIKKLDVINDIDVFIYSLLIGGIIGNLIDRIVYGYVIDYLSINFGKYYFPIFNFADICIVVSILLMLFQTIKGDLWK